MSDDDRRLSFSAFIFVFGMCVFPTMLCGCAAPTDPTPDTTNDAKIALKSKSGDTATLSIRELQDRYANMTLEVIEPLSSVEMTFVGVPALKVLEDVCGDLQNVETILFRCLDGYESEVSVADILQWKPLLAYDVQDGEFQTTQDGKDVELGPLYLVWNNKESDELLQRGATGWPYQVSEIVVQSDR